MEYGMHNMYPDSFYYALWPPLAYARGRSGIYFKAATYLAAETLSVRGIRAGPTLPRWFRSLARRRRACLRGETGAATFF